MPTIALAAATPAGTPFLWSGAGSPLDNFGEYMNWDVPEGATNLVSIDAGAGYTLALRQDGTVIAWGASSAVDQLPPGLSNIVAITAGYYHAFALRADGTLIGWGGVGHVHREAMLNPPVWLTNVVQISAGMSHTVATTADGYLVAWGNPDFAVLSAPLDIRYPRFVGSGQQVSIALASDGKPTLWGRTESELLPLPKALTNGVKVDIGPFGQAVAFNADGRVFSWGYNSQGQATLPAAATNAIDVAAGAEHTLALRADGTVVAWGSPAGRVPPGAPRMYAIAAGDQHNVGLTLGPVGRSRPSGDGVLAGGSITLSRKFESTIPYTLQWRLEGNPLEGETGPELVLRNVQARHNGFYTLVASNEFGVAVSTPFQLTVFPAPPTIVSGPTNQAVRSGGDVEFQVSAGGTEPFSYQWLFNDRELSGETNRTLHLTGVGPDQAGSYRVTVRNGIGEGVTSTAAFLSTGKPVFSLQPLSRILRPGLSSELLTEVVAPVGDGVAAPTLQWWFNNQPLEGQTGLALPLHPTNALQAGLYSLVASNAFGTATSRVTQVEVLAFPAPRSEPGVVVSWGSSFAGSFPPPANLTNAIAIAAGAWFGAAIRADGTVAVWTPESSEGVFDMLRPPAGLTDVVDLAAGFDHCLALKSDGIVVAWGILPAVERGATQVPEGLSNVVQVAASHQVSFALRADGSVVRWPDPDHLPLGLKDVVLLDADDSMIIALTTDGSVWRWETGAPNTIRKFPDLDVQQITAGAAHAWVLTRDSLIYNITGTASVPVPNPVHGPEVPVEIAAGSNFSLVRSPDGLVWTAGTEFVPGTEFIPPPDIPAGLLSADRIAANYLMALATTRYPFIGGVLQPRVINTGERLELGYDVRGVEPLRMEWRKDGIPVPGQNSATLLIAAARSRDSGNYELWVEGSTFSTSSAAVAVTVVGPPEITGPNPVSVGAGRTVTLSPQVEGKGPFGMQWFFRGEPLPKATNATLVIRNVQADDDGEYFLKATNQYGTTQGDAARLTVQPSAPGLGVDLADATFLEGGELVLEVGVHGSEPMTFQWVHNGTAHPEVTGPRWVIPGAQPANAGEYTVRISNPLGAVVSRSAVATSTPTPPVFGKVPSFRVVNAGNDIVLAPAYVGSVPMDIQWYKDGVPLPAGTNGTLVFHPAQTNDTARYTLSLTNRLGFANSDSMDLVVRPGGGPGALVAWGATTLPANLGLVQQVETTPVNTLNTFAVTAAGGVVGWGSNPASLPQPPADLRDVVAVACGNSFAAALRTDGTVVTWASALPGRFSAATNWTRVVGIAAGSTYLLAWHSDGGVSTAGDTVGGGRSIPAGLSNVVQLAAYGNSSAGLGADGRPFTWGTEAGTPPPSTVSNIVAIDCGVRFSLGLTREGLVQRWGTGIAAPPTSLSNVVAIAAGTSHALAVRSNGTVVAWGVASSGDTVVPPGLSNVVGVTAGPTFSLARTRNPLARTIPATVIGTIGEPVEIRSNPVGLPPLELQWLRNGQALDGQTNATLRIAQATAEDANTYSLRVRNPWGEATTNPARLTIVGPVGFAIRSVDFDAMVVDAKAPGATRFRLLISTDFTNWTLYQQAAAVEGAAAFTIPVNSLPTSAGFRLQVE